MKIVCGKKIKYLSALLAGVFFSISCLFPLEAKAAVTWPEAPGIMAGSAILIDADTGSVLYSKSAEDKMYPASTTKLMTVLLALENSDFSETVTMSYDSLHSLEIEAKRVGVVEGEQLSMKDSLYAILLGSANEVSYAVAEHVGGGDFDTFIGMMNERAKELGCVNTHFTNPHGLHEPDHYTCANDLALIMKACLDHPEFPMISNNTDYTLSVLSKNGTREIDVYQTHKFLRKKLNCEGAFAGKTGYTDEARNCLVTAAKRNGMTLICVVLGDPKDADCYTDTNSLFDYGFGNFRKEKVSSGEEMINAFPMLFNDDEAYIRKAASDLSLSEAELVIPAEAKLTDVYSSCELVRLLELKAGYSVIGKVSFTCAGRNVGNADVLLYSDSYKVLDMAELYLREYGGTEEYDEKLYRILSGTYVEEEVKKPDFRPALIGYSVGTVILIIGLIVMIRMYLRVRRY